MAIDLTKAVTDDFVESFKTSVEFSGLFWHLILRGVDEDPRYLPVGLDETRPDAKAIIDKARQWRKENPQ